MKGKSSAPKAAAAPKAVTRPPPSAAKSTPKAAAAVSLWNIPVAIYQLMYLLLL